jgi:putative membrane protein
LTLSQLLSDWNPAQLVLAAAFVAGLRFGHAFARLRRRGRRDHASWSRAALFAFGLALVTLPLVSPLDAAGDGYLLSAHMLEHVLIADAGPALILLAVRGPLLAFMLPVAAVRAAGSTPLLHRSLAWLGRPAVALAAWAATIACWHIPAVYDATLRHQALHDLEHAMFVGAGALVWMQLIDPARRHRLSTAGKIAYAGALFLIGEILSSVLFLSSAPLYPAYAGQPDRLFGLSALQDQQYAGLVMMGEQLITLGLCVALLVGASLRDLERRPSALAEAL